MGTKLHADKAEKQKTTQVSAASVSTNIAGRPSQPVRTGADAFSAGKDVFFARGAFDRSDPASRGLLAHELSHSMQQGVGGEGSAVAQSAPMGAAQGGLIEWFKGLLGKSAETDADTDANAATDANIAADANADVNVAAVNDAEANAATNQDPQGKLTDLVWQLTASSRGGFGGNSDYFNNVYDSFSAVNRILTVGRFTNQLQNNLQLLTQAQSAYRELLQSCAAYTARTPLTPAGKHRRSIVLQIQELAQKDLLGLGDAISDFCAMPDDEQAGQTWSSVLSKARSIRLSVRDYSQMTAATGGQASEVYKLNGSNTSVRNSDGSATALDGMHFFKPEDSIDASSPNGAVEFHSYYVALNETLKRFPNMPKKDAEKLKDFVQKRTVGHAMILDDLRPQISKKGLNAFNFFVQWQDRNSTTIDSLLVPSGTLSQGGSINTTRRNVATSRMASLLGVGHLVAKSQTAEVYDETTGQTHRGNIMAAAQGKEYKSLLAELQADASHRKGDTSNFTGEFQRDMTSLQVLDVLCGQSDRHVNNMFYKTTENGKLSGVQGIDNDASFGLNTDVLYTKDSNRSDRRVYDPESGDMVLPYMDAALAERIQSLDGAVVRYALQDLLTEREINAAIQRLEMMKSAISKARAAQEAAPNAPHRFLNDDEWTDETAQHMMEEDARLFEEYNPKVGWNPDKHPDQQKALTDMLRYVYNVLGYPDPEKAAQALLKKLVKDRTPEEKRIFRLAQNAAVENFERNRMKRTRANGSYFGAFASSH